MDQDEFNKEICHNSDYKVLVCPSEEFEEVVFCAESGNVCLHIAAERNCMSIADQLLSKSQNIEIRNSRGETPLMVAIIYKRIELVKKLLNKGANFEAEDEHYDTPLLQAIHVYSNPIVDMLLSKGASLLAENMYYQTPLHLAITYGYCSIIDKLIKASINVNIHNVGGETPMELALNRGRIRVAEKLLAKGAFMCPYIVLRALLLCHTEILDILLDFVLRNGFDINTRGSEGSTILHLVVVRQYEEGVRKLLDKGADVNAKDNLDETPLIAASRLENLSIVSLLIERGACVNVINANGNTPLYVTIKFWNIKMMYLLLNSGADMHLTEKSQVNSLILAFTLVMLPKAILSLVLNARKMELAKLPVRLTHNDRKINKNLTTLKAFEENCVRELEHMKVKKFAGLPLYSIFSTCNNPVFTNNPGMKKYIRSESLILDFPYYADLLKRKFKDGIKKSDLLDELCLSFKAKHSAIVLPHEISRKILANLEYVELIGVKKAFRV